MMNCTSDPVHLPEKLRAGFLPVEERHVFRLPGWHVWCVSVVQDRAGLYHLFASRWPASSGFEGWVTHSEIVRATSPTLEGPFTFAAPVFQRNEGPGWDAHVTHNGTVREFGGRYYLYYTGNRGDGTFWDHRNNQRIGVAVADDPAGPWVRSETPLIDVSPEGWDSLMVSNPTVTDLPDGRFLMIYKGVTDGPRPFGGKVLHGAAFAESPAGPFIKTGEPLFAVENVVFAYEDPYVYRDGQRLYCIMKRMPSAEEEEPALLLFTSLDGREWRPAEPRVVHDLTMLWADGTRRSYERIERPQLFFDRQGRGAFMAAVKPHGETLAFCVRRIFG